MFAIVKSQSLWRTALVDAAMIAAACLVPVLSHLAALPFYKLNPMLLVLLGGMLLVDDRRNALLMAILLPMVSMLAVGMPAPAKAFCMAAEYLTVVLVSGWLLPRSSHFWGTAGAMLSAMLCGKAAYYLLKAFAMAPAVLVGTPLYLQIGIMLAAALVYSLLSVKRK